VRFLSEYHNTEISVRTLHHQLADYGLSRPAPFMAVWNAIRQELRVCYKGKSGQYRLAGELVQRSVSNGGPGLPLSQYTYNSLLGRSVTDTQHAIHYETHRSLHQVVDEVGKRALLCTCTDNIISHTVHVVVCTGLLVITATCNKLVNVDALTFTEVSIR